MAKLKAFADDKLNIPKMKNSVFGYQHFLLFPQSFAKPSCLGSLKSGLCGKELTVSHTITTFDDPKERAF